MSITNTNNPKETDATKDGVSSAPWGYFSVRLAAREEIIISMDSVSPTSNIYLNIYYILTLVFGIYV